MTLGLGEFFALAAAFAWAVAILLFRISGRQLGPYALNLYKNTLVLFLLLPTIAVVHGFAWPDTALWPLAILLLSGFIGIGIADTLYFKALNQLGASRTAIGGTLLTPGVIVLSFTFLGERLSLQQLCGAVITLIGVTIVNYQRVKPINADAERAGLWALVAAMGLMAAGIVMTKPLLATEPFLWVVEIRVFGGVMGMLLLGAWQRDLRRVAAEYRAARQWGLTTVAAFIGTYVAMLLWLGGYKYADASVAAVLNESSAVFTIALAALFMRERLNRQQWFGSGVALLGIALVVA